MGRSTRRAVLGVLALTLLGCRPDVPGRGCKTDDDCFTQEQCAQGTCVDRAQGGAADATGETVADGASLDALPVADAGASADAVP